MQTVRNGFFRKCDWPGFYTHSYRSPWSFARGANSQMKIPLLKELAVFIPTVLNTVTLG